MLVFKHLLKLLDIQVSWHGLKDYWLSHPDYLSMCFFADTCKNYKIDYLALNIQPSDFGKNGFPFITHFADDGGHFIVVENINNNEEVLFYQPFIGYKKVALNEFFSHWSGIVFYAYPNEISGERDYAKKRFKEIIKKISPLLFIVVLLALLFGSFLLVQPTFSLLLIFLFVIKLFGLFICINLLYNELVGDNWFSQAVCNNKYASCKEVMQSPASKFFGIHMSDFGFIYFCGGAIILIESLYLHLQSLAISFLIIMALFSIPYIVFSVYYQLFKIKKICSFCMSVMFTLSLEIILAIINWDIKFVSNLFCWQILFPLGSFLLVALGLIPIKEIIRKANDGIIYKYRYLRLKKNPLIFNASLDKENPVDMEIHTDELIIGNEEASTTITAIINVNCAPCIQTYNRIYSIVKEYEEDIRVVIRFMLLDNNQRESFFFIRLFYTKGKDIFSKVLYDWFQNKDYENLIREFGNVKYDLESDLVQHWNNWFKKNDITSTPIIFLNDKKIPQEYDVDDIHWLLENSLYSNS